ncbi:MAG TPA: hypothetical protein PKA77_17730 [Chitinophagaceae bacterium]|jgi:hypothetical protein|nr:hypothetical protein [Chitinophagaceae bacterium]HMU60039.1 hypothetical protein [Chitinophagaceae bacterium]
MKLKNAALIATTIYTLAVVIGCKKTDDEQPIPANPTIVSTKPATNIGSTSVVSGGELVSATNITDRGIIWGSDSNTLTVSNLNKISNGAGSSSFTDTIQNLQPSTSYYVRAYAIYVSGVTYGAAVKFTTLPPQPTVYIAGYHGSSAAYWKNGQLVSLPNGIKANSIYVVGNDVYAAGENLSGGSGRAVYWKNGNVVYLTNGVRYGIAKSIQVSGNDVYVAGYDYNTNGFPYPIVKYWKNGTEVSLTAGTPYNYGLGNSIHVSGSDVYVAGYSANQSLGSFTACYWKNGQQVTLSDSTSSIAEARSIFVAGNDVYVAGQVRPGLGLGGVQIATYWKNVQAVSLTNGPAWACVFSIYINGSDVYAAGYEENNATGGSFARYWKNGVAFTLPGTNLYNSAHSIYVLGNDVYVVGSESDGYYDKAKYWKNGVEIPLEISSNFSDATSVFVK